MHPSKFVRLALLPALLIAIFATAQPAFASHFMRLTGISCDPASNSVTVTGTNDFVESSAGFDLYINGTYVDSYSLQQIGTSDNAVVTITLPEIIFSAVIRAENTNGGAVGGPTSVSTTCKDPVPGPPIPAGFVLRTIVCTVSVYENADLNRPVGSNRLKAGQTWYVNPVTMTGTNGESWSEVFVAGVLNGYIPTRCVGAASTK